MSEYPEDETQKPGNDPERELSKPLESARKSFWSSDKLLSLFAFLISVGTFSTFAYQTYLIQKQQYASTMPYLMLFLNNDGSGEYTQHSITLANNGIGPAFIQDIKIHYQDSIFQQDPSAFYFGHFSPADTSNYSVNNQDIFPGFAIPAGGEVLLIGSVSEYSASVIYDLFYGGKTTVEITYTSVYDEVWKITDDGAPEKID